MPNSIPSAADVERHVLPNGIVVLVRENFDAQSVVLTGSFAGGAIFEQPTQRGLASLTADALMRGTGQHDFQTLHEILESSGMSLDIDAGRYTANFDGKALGEDFPMLVELLANALRQPSFPAEHVELLKGEIITGLRYNQQDTRYMAGKTFRQLAYPPEHMSHHSSSGEVESISPLTADDLRRFHEQQYGPGAMIIVVVGAVKAAEALARLESSFGDWEKPGQQTDWSQPDLPEASAIRSQSVTLPGKTQSDIVMGVPGPSRFAEDYRAASIGNNIFGVFGMMGRLGAAIRENEGMAYYCYSSLDGGLDRGAWRISAGVNPVNVKKAVGLMREELERILTQPVDADELEDNKSSIIGQLPLRLETNDGVAGNLLAMERYQLGLDYLLHYEDEIRAVDAAEIQAAIQHYWKPDAFALAVAGPALDEQPL